MDVDVSEVSVVFFKSLISVLLRHNFGNREILFVLFSSPNLDSDPGLVNNLTRLYSFLAVKFEVTCGEVILACGYSIRI